MCHLLPNNSKLYSIVHCLFYSKQKIFFSIQRTYEKFGTPGKVFVTQQQE